ncbi:MAG TPA: hypothetical protein VFX59_11370, partial [Polyangiales bacterium]|nr:hypothetical protein [Polyangiales bacterium]
MLGSIDVAASGCSVRAWCVLLAATLGACGDELAATTPDQANLLVQRVPELGCFEDIPSPGSCQRSADCAEPALRCVHDQQAQNVDRGAAPLRCGTPVGARAAHALCSQGSDCESGLCALTGVCVEPCLSDEDCGLSDACRPVETRLGNTALQPVMACTRALVLPDDVAVSYAPRGYELGKGRDALSIPGADTNALVYVQGECGKSLDLLTLRSNDLGRTVYDRDGLRDGKRQENTILHDGSALAALVYPNNPLLTAMTTGLQLGVRSGNAQHAESVTLSRPRGRGVLDLNLFYVGGGSELEKGGFHPGDKRVREMLQVFDERLHAMDGLALGAVHEFDVVGALREELAVLDVPRRKVGDREIEGRPERLEELFRLSAGLETPGVNVFIIGDMGDYIGIAGGIPGPLGLHGTERSGLALAADLMGDMVGADQVLLHEIAHYLGLFHTSESSGSILEPLADTPECDKSFDSNEDGVLGTDECEGHGAENLMFWTGPGVLLSPQQIDVFASS